MLYFHIKPMRSSEIIKNYKDNKLVLSSVNHIMIFLIDRLKALRSDKNDSSLNEELEFEIDFYASIKRFINTERWHMKRLFDNEFLFSENLDNQKNLLESSITLGGASILELVGQLQKEFSLFHTKFTEIVNYGLNKNNKDMQHIYQAVSNINNKISGIRILNTFLWLEKFEEHRGTSIQDKKHRDTSNTPECSYVDILDMENGKLVIKKILTTPQALSFINSQ